MYQFCTILLCSALALTVAVPAKQSKVLELLFQNYDKNVRPNIGGEPVDVAVTMYIIENKVIEETKTKLTLESNLYFRRYWNDSRLSFNGGETIVGSKDLHDKIWTPDLFFANSDDVQNFEVPNPNMFVKITPEGNVFVSDRLRVRWSCPQSLLHVKFPCDTLRCGLEIESYGYSMKDINLTIRKKDALGVSEAGIPNFKLIETKLVTTQLSLSTGEYSRLVAEMYFKRNLPDAKFIIPNDGRFPEFYSSIRLKPKFEQCNE